MAFQQHTTQENTQSRQQILQEVQQQKKRLLLMNQQGPSTGSGLAGTSHGIRSVGDAITPTMPVNQRQALEIAQATSSGYFISQDSSYGNLILPVIPRVDPE